VNKIAVKQAEMLARAVPFSASMRHARLRRSRGGERAVAFVDVNGFADQ
jgi:hypothetical protein